MAQYPFGTQIDITATFTDNGTPADPTSVYFDVQEPDGVITTYEYGVDAEVTKSSTGVYVFSHVPDQEDVHFYRARGTGVVAVSTQDQEFTVVETRFN